MIVVAASGEFGGIQIKDKVGKFSITQEEPCGMLERWAAVVETRPGSWFRFCSPQQAGNLHDHSTSFPRWVGGDQSATVRNELRESLGKFVSKKHTGKFPRLERLTKASDEFKTFWDCIDWRLGGIGLDELVTSLLKKIGICFPGDVEPSTRRYRLFAWVGALALSASSENIDDRRWTKQRLFAVDPKSDVRLALVAGMLDRLLGAQAKEHAEILAEILSTVRLVASRRTGPVGDPPAGGEHRADTVDAALPARWVHETSNDEQFTGRRDECERLNRWVRDDATRIVAVHAVAGMGKTALVGHWLRTTSGWRSRPFAGLFAWSFYQNRSTDQFLFALLQWAQATFGTPPPRGCRDLVGDGARLLRERALVLVLDGLEVLQEGPEATRHGAFLDTGLRELLQVFCEDARNRSVAVLTSRFIFADLGRYLGTAFHQLALPGLSPDLGALLLSDLGTRGPAEEREEVSRQLEGHPFLLRLFAESLPDADRGRPGGFLNHVFRPLDTSSGTSLAGKLHRLLRFYEQTLLHDHGRLLTVVALFRSPVPEEALLNLMRGLFGQDDPPVSDNAGLSRTLDVLHHRGILSREPIEGGHGYACHPILRDYFRAVLSGSTPSAVRAAELLADRPSKEPSRSMREIEPVLAAIDLLLEAGECKLAWSLFDERLEKGEIFKRLGSPTEGLRCVTGFVRDEQRRALAERDTPDPRYFDRLQAIFEDMVGHFTASLASKKRGECDDTVYPLLELGRVDEARQVAAAHAYAARGDFAEIMDEKVIDDLAYNKGYGPNFARETLWRRLELRALDRSLAYGSLAHVAALQGNVLASAEYFAISIALWHSGTYAEFSSGLSVHYAEFCLRCGHTRRASDCMDASLRECEKAGWVWHAAQCSWMLGWCGIAEGRLDAAEAALHCTESALRRSHLIPDLARLHLTAGALALARGDASAALHRAAAALGIAQPRGMNLVQADALVLRGRGRLLEAGPDAAIRALDDATDALHLARDCSYAWAERDARSLEAESHECLAFASPLSDLARASDERAAASKARREAETLTAKMALAEGDLAEAQRTADAWFAAWREGQLANAQ